MAWVVPDARHFDSLVDLLDDATTRWAGRRQLALRTDDGLHLPWTAAELNRRSKLVAWRLRALGLQPGDRLLTWSPATPALPAVYFGAMRAGVIVVPLDLRMAPEVLQRLAEKAEAKWLAIGTGFDAPDAAQAGLNHLNIRTVESLGADPPHERADATDEGGIDEPFPADWEAQVDSWPRPTRDTLFEVIYTSGTTGMPKGVMLDHGAILSTLEAIRKIIPNREERTVSLLPASHLFDQAPILFYGLSIGADILYLRSRTPRIIFKALAEHRVTTMVVVPQVLELFWNAITREIERRGKRRTFDMVRTIARRLPYPARRWIFRAVHAQFGGGLNLFICSGAFLPPALQQGWEDLGVVVMQGYGASESGLATMTTKRDHGIGTVGRSIPPNEVRLADDGEILVRGPAVFPGYFDDPEATRAAFDDEGFYHTGDVGHWDGDGHLVLSGRKKNMIVLPNGFNVFPEDIENALHIAGIRDAVVLETQPGRIEAVVLPGEGPAAPRPAEEQRAAGERAAEEDAPVAVGEAERARIEEAIKEANRSLGIHQRVEGWRIWPEADFPRTHTLKVKRDLVRAWVDADAPLKVREGDQA